MGDLVNNCQSSRRTFLGHSFGLGGYGMAVRRMGVAYVGGFLNELRFCVILNEQNLPHFKFYLMHNYNKLPGCSRGHVHDVMSEILFCGCADHS
jgi:hypothetical protein